MEISKRQLQENYNPSDFNNIPELSQIGTEEQYSAYLDTIFPSSKINQIMYHKTSAEKFDEFKVSRLGGVYFSFFDVPTRAGFIGKMIAKLTKERMVLAKVNVINPFIINRNNYKDIEKKTGGATQSVTELGKKYDLSGYDSILGYPNPLYDKGELDNFPQINFIEGRRKDLIELAVFNPKNIHILGSKQDIEGFRNFVNNTDMEITKRQLQDEEVTAYHGSPHSFDKFSTQYVDDKGFQTYGWGLYFNDLKSIAKDMIYAKAGEKGGYVYKVTLHKGKTPEQYNWLVWDKPLTDNQKKLIIDQSRKENLKPIKKISLGDEDTKITPESVITSFSPKALGMEIYRNISGYFNDKKEASLFLLRAGIDGIKYPKTVFAKTSAFGYVVFDENAVTIEKQTQLEEMEVSKKDLIQNWMNNPKKLKEDAEEITKGELEEAKKKKADRCLKIARRKMPQTSAYRSGNIVRCRQGKIWKGLKEEDENFDSDDINLSDYNGITVELGRSKELGIGTVQNIIVKYKGIPITGENNEPGLGNMNVVIQSKDAFVGNIIIPTEFKGTGLAKHIYQATADLIGKPIVDSTKRGQSQSEKGGYVWKNRDSFQPNLKPLEEKWSQKYKRSIDCNNPKGFSQKAHCKGRLKEGEGSGNVDEKVESRKNKQLEIINKTNPAPNDQNTWIRNIEDILSPKDAFKDDDNFIGTPDFTIKDAKEALKNGEIIVYSSYPIKNGVFVTPSKMEATLYAGNKNPYSKKVKLTDVAWIDSNEGQYAEVNTAEQLNEKGSVGVGGNVEVSIDSNGKYNPNSILAYFGNILYTKRNGFQEFTDSEYENLSEKTKQYLIRIYDKVKLGNDNYERKVSPKYPNGVDSFYNKPIDTDRKRIEAARVLLSFDPRRESSEDKINSIEYPSQEVLKNLDGVFNGESEKYNAEQSLDEKTDYSKEKEQGLHGWFARQGGKGKSKGWVDCNTCRDGKCKSCGRKEGESRSKYPACRPTPSACKTKGKGKSWGKKSKLNEDNQYLLPEEINEVLKGYIETALWTEEERLNDEYGSEHNKVFKDYDDYKDKEDTELDKLIKLSANINNKGIEKFSKEDIESDSLIKAYSDIKKFIQLAGDSVYEAIYENGLERLGTDIWFTRNGHGSGFFDHSYDDDDEKKLIQAGKSLGSVDLYINDNLKLSFSNQHLYEQSKQDIERELKLNENEEFPIQSLYREKENMEIKKKDIFDEDLVLKRDQSKKAIYVQSDLDSDKARSQETFKNKEALKSAGFKWDGDIKSWKTDDVNFMLAKKTIETINKKEFLIDTLEQLEEIIASSENTPEKEGLMGKIDMYINDLSNATDEAAMSSEIRRYLTFFSKFRGHSLFNTWLIYIQSGGKATKVAGFRQWEAKFYRRVKKGAKGLQIFVPIFTKSTSKDDETGEEITKENAVRFKPGYVFDISDTEPIDERGEVPEEPNWFADLEPTERSIELYKYFIELCEDMGIQISKSGSERGEKGYSAGNKINISSAREGAGEVSTLVHEIAHELMHWKKSSIYFQDKTDAKLRELQAESVSYVVLKHYELPTEHHPTYLALWKANKEKIKENVKVITDVAKFIISEIDKIEKRNQKNEVINEQVFKDVKNIFKRFMK